MNAKTWADGLGRWHAVVADTPRGLINAVNAMASEIHERAPRSQSLADVKNYLHSNIITEPTQDGTIHFVEYALAD